MLYRKLGTTDLRLSVIGLGTYQFGGSWGKDFSQAEVNNIIDTAIDEGLNFIDTAECYGPGNLAENLLGKALKGKRNKVILATKFGHKRVSPLSNEQRWSPEDVLEQLENSLKVLGTDVIDLYQFHSGTNEVFDNDELWTMLDNQKREGKIRYLGISLSRAKSEYRIHQAELASEVGASAVQVLYNRLDRKAETEIIDICRNSNTGVIARVPLASGLLSGKYQPGLRFSENDSRFKKYSPELIDAFLREAEDIRRNEVPEGKSLLEWSITWPLKNSAVSSVIPGVKTPEHVKGNARSASSGLVSENHPLAV